jgi:hypothetical protein
MQPTPGRASGTPENACDLRILSAIPDAQTVDQSESCLRFLGIFGVSVFVHGMTAYAGSQKYADWYDAQNKNGLVEARKVHHSLSPRLRREVETAGGAVPENQE